MDTREVFDGLVRGLLRQSHMVKPSDLARLVNAAASEADLRVTIYLVDYEQRQLRPLPGGFVQPGPVSVGGSLPGRVFATIEIQAVAGSPGTVWAPILDGTARLGVLGVALSPGMDQDDPAVRDGCLAVASLVGHLIQAKNVLGDSLQTTRRSTAMTVASELLWSMVPPTTFACEELVLSAVLEPCYDVGGDGFDYSVDASLAKVAILDALGHGLQAALTCCVALASMRAARRRGADLAACAAAADVEIATQWTDTRFATAVLAELRLDTGTLRYLNAGHPPAVLVRAGRAIRHLDGARRVPLGLGRDTPEPAEEALEPGDRLLFYTDGVTEARDEEGRLFGLDRLVELTERHAGSGMPTPEVLRRLSHAVLEHQKGVLQDDATLVLLEWSPDAVARTMPFAVTSAPD